MTRPKVSPLSPLIPLITFMVLIAVLYLGREILIPFSLALLLGFILTPVVKRMEALRLGRGVSVVLVSLFSLILTGAIAWAMLNQLVDVVGQLPNYKENIHRKAQAVMAHKSGGLSQVTENVQELSSELKTAPPDQPAQAAARHPAKSAKNSSPPETPQRPVPVELVEPPPNALQSLRNLIGPLLAPLGTAGIVIVFTIFLLIEREEVRNRLFRLAGRSQIHLVTNALDDAAQRVSRYLFLQLLVNCAFGAIVGFGLFFIGVPNALLWGVLGAILRFVPYVGPLIAGALPLILSLAVAEGWREPILTFVLFLVTELIMGNVVEPKLYGAHTGISALAILVAAVFWTILWGPIGLLLSTPLTVCLVVLGRHVPQLEFLNIVLGDEPVLSAETMFYQRLLALDQDEARKVVDSFLKTGGLLQLYDSVLIPALSMAEQDRHTGILDEAKENFVFQSISEMVVELGAASTRDGLESFEGPRPRIICVPAHDIADEITAAMLAQVAELQGFPVISLSVDESSTDQVREIATMPDDVVCVSALPPFALLHASRLSRVLRAQLANRKIIVGVWTSSALGQGTENRVERAFAGPVVTSLAQALEELGGVVDIEKLMNA